MLANCWPYLLIASCARDFAAGFAVDLQAKDTRLIQQAASELGVPMPGTALVHQLWTALQASGRGGLGTQALVQVLEEMSACRVGG